MTFDVEFEEVTNEFNAEFESSNNEFGVEFESTVAVAGGLTEEVKQALLDLFQHLAYTDANGQDYYDALYNAFYPPRELANIVAVYTQTGTVYPDTPLDDLKTDLVVTARYTDGTTEEVTDYTLSGTLTAGRSTVTVSYGGKTTTFSVTVTAPATLSSITAVYTQSGVVYPTDSLDSLKPDLVVTAHYSDSSTATVTTYTLSGTLAVGTSTITVTYSGKTTTFNVTVTEAVVLDSIMATYTQSGAVYDTDSLDSLKADLVVTAVYTDSSTEVVPSTDYTLSGTLTAGTSTITVTYESKTTSFNVTVTAGVHFFEKMSITSSNGNPPTIATGSTETARGSGVAIAGTHPIKYQGGTYSDYYPVEIPSGATGIIVSSNDLDCGCVEFYYNGTDWIRETSAGWLLKSSGTSHTYSFQGSQKTHITMPFRQAGYSTGGTVTQAMMDAVQFSWKF